MNISAAGVAIHADLFSVSGSGFSAGSNLVFEQGGTQVSVAANFLRPHFALVTSLPGTVPVGANSLTIRDGSTVSNALPVAVTSGAPLEVRELHAGANKPSPYTIVFVATPAVRDMSGGFNADPILADRAGFQSVVTHCFRNLFGVTEDLLRAGDIDVQMRMIALFDASLPALDDNALAGEIAPNLMETRRTKLAPFLAGHGIVADFVFVLHGSTTHTRATAWYTSDDNTAAGTACTYDGVPRRHGHFPRIPGSAAVPLSVNPDGLTIIHEFGHGASDFVNGRVADLYVDGSPAGFAVNKKWRDNPSDPVPSGFATYNSIGFSSDALRDSLGYPPTWKSYQPELIDATRPNLMDNYWQADDPHLCRFDRLTYRWFRNRLAAKMSR